MSDDFMAIIEGLRSSSGGSPLDQLKRAIVTYDVDLARSAASRVVEEQLDPVSALQAMTDAIRLVGEGYGTGELWLPDLVGAAEAMSAATPIIDGEVVRLGGSTAGLGTVVIGTVYGDIHSIGKNMVTSLLRAEGFVVHDLGVNISAAGFVDAAKSIKPDIVALSALLTTTAPQMTKIIGDLGQLGLPERVKVMVGGGAITQAFAERIGADGYEATAPGAARLARRLVE